MMATRVEASRGLSDVIPADSRRLRRAPFGALKSLMMVTRVDASRDRSDLMPADGRRLRRAPYGALAADAAYIVVPRPYGPQARAPERAPAQAPALNSAIALNSLFTSPVVSVKKCTS